MSIETPKFEPGISEVVSGIVTDFQKLISQQIALLRAEVSEDWQKTSRALRPIFAGGALAATGVILLGFATAFCLHWSVTPAADASARFPLWACFGVAAILFLGAGIGLIGMGVRMFHSFNPLPNASAEALEKNLSVLADASHGSAQA